MSDIYTEWQIKARKRHTCHLCGRSIKRGSEYIRVKWYDDGFQEVARHIHCDALLQTTLDELTDPTSFDADEVTEILRDTCVDLHNKGICADEDYEHCDDTDCYACFLVQRDRLEMAPTLLRAAEQSAKDNSEY